MSVVKNSVAMIAVMLLSGATMAAEPAKPAGTYADTSSTQANAAQPVPADVNTNVPYASMLPKDAEIVPGAPGKNEFFIVAAEDAAKIKQLIDHTKPGRDIVASDIKSKQPIVKVKLDESNATLVSMDIVSSVKAVANDAVKTNVQMTANDEVMSIFTKNRMTPVGSRVVAGATPVKAKVTPAEIDEKPMLKLLALSNDTQPVSANNPLTTTAVVKPATKVVMPDTVAVKQTIQRPIEKPVELPPASKETAPTLEMVLQQAKNGGVKVNNETVVALKTAVRAADAKVNKAVVTHTSTVTATKAVATHKLAAKAPSKKQAAKKVAGKIISYEQIKPATKKVSWGARHAAEAKTKKIATRKIVTEKVASKKITSKKIATTKRPLNVGVVHSYADYLSKTGHHTRQSAE